MRTEKFKAKIFIDAIPGTAGIIATIAKRVGCEWHTVKKYIERYPTVKKVYEDECSKIDDLAVSVVIEAIQNKDIPTAKWWLSKKRKDEFGDSVDLTAGGEVVLKIVRGND